MPWEAANSPTREKNQRMILIMAWRNIWRNRKRSLIITGSVALGIMAGLFIMALYQGMIDARIRTVIQDEAAHLQIHHPAFKPDRQAADTIPDSHELLIDLAALDEVDRFSPRLIALGMLATATGSAGVEIRGVTPAREKEVGHLDTKVVQGAYFPGNRKNEILVGKALVNKKGLELNKKVVLTFTDTDKTIVSGAFRIVGIYESTNTALDERIVYTQRDDMASLLGVGDAVHEVAIVLKEDGLLDPASQRLQTSYPQLLIETWRQIAPETELLVTVFNRMGFVVLIIIMITLAFGIINTMLMAILERIREIGMMIALGMNKVRLFFLVLLETTLLTVIGTPFGIGVTWLFILYFSRQGIDTTAFAEAMMSDYGFERIIYPQFPNGQIGEMILLIAGTAVLASIIPAWRALRMEPADALRK